MGVVHCLEGRRRPLGQQGGVGLLADELQAQALLMVAGEGGVVVQAQSHVHAHAHAVPAVLAAVAHVVDQLVHEVAVLLGRAIVVVQVRGDVVGRELFQDLLLQRRLLVVVAPVDDLDTVAHVLGAGDAVAVAVVTIQW